MNSKSAGILSIIGAIAALSVSTPAGAEIAATRSGSYVLISHESHLISPKYLCNGLYAFVREQRMTIEGGPSEFVLINKVIPPGRYRLISRGTCDGFFIFLVAQLRLQEPGAVPSADVPPGDRPKPRPTPAGGGRG
jgi:hypothetical protein